MKTTKQTQDAFIASLMPDSDKKMVRIASASLVVALMLGFWALVRSCLNQHLKVQQSQQQ